MTSGNAKLSRKWGRWKLICPDWVVPILFQCSCGKLIHNQNCVWKCHSVGQFACNKHTFISVSVLFLLLIALLFVFLIEHHQPCGWDLPAPSRRPCSRHHNAHTGHTTHRYHLHTFRCIMPQCICVLCVDSVAVSRPD